MMSRSTAYKSRCEVRVLVACLSSRRCRRRLEVAPFLARLRSTIAAAERASLLAAFAGRARRQES